MSTEPRNKKAAVFVDGQNLFYAAKYAFGHQVPNYDIKALAKAICKQQQWSLVSTHFYTGIPKRKRNPELSEYWQAKLVRMRNRGIHTYSRSLQYRKRLIELPDGSTTFALIGQEKGIDVRLALDVVRLARCKEFDVAIIFSQDQDLSEVADEVKRISIDQNRWIKVACAFPDNPSSSFNRGINRTQWIRIDRALYDLCIDPRDLFPRSISGL